MSHNRHTFHAHPTWFDFTNLDQCTFNPPLPTTYPYPPNPPPLSPPSTHRRIHKLLRSLTHALSVFRNRLLTEVTHSTSAASSHYRSLPPLPPLTTIPTLLHDIPTSEESVCCSHLHHSPTPTTLAPKPQKTQPSRSQVPTANLIPSSSSSYSSNTPMPYLTLPLTSLSMTPIPSRTTTNKPALHPHTSPPLASSSFVRAFVATCHLNSPAHY